MEQATEHAVSDAARRRAELLPGFVKRLGHWAIIILAGLVGWGLLMIAAVVQGVFIALFFPAGWCLYVAFRQYADYQKAYAESR